MLLDRTQVRDSDSTRDSLSPSASAPTSQPLTCMIYFFASQMARNLYAPEPSPSSDANTKQPPVHRLDTLLSKISVHAGFSPLITQFETFPVEIPPASGRPKKNAPSRESMHDTMLLVRFKSKRAREQWIETREWQEFMERTEREGVFRRIPHVRCAGSLKGLRDPMEVLGI